MKQLLFLLLFPCFALAQYQGNANQKITLGEQTTADGLVYRGVANLDTVAATSKITRANKQDTSAFLLLDTVTNLLWHYKIGSNKWIQAGGGDTSLIAYVNTYGTQTVNGAKTFTSAVTAARFNPTANTATGTGMFAPTSTSLGFSTNGTNRMTLDASGNLGLGVTPYSTSSLIKTFDFNTTGGFGSYSNSTNTQFTYLSSNAYINVGVNWAYKYSGVPASTFMQNTGEYQWFTAPSGTADNIISFTRVMTLTNNGNLGIGTDGPSEKLHVVGNARISAMNGINDIGASATGVLQAATSDMNLKNTIEDSPFGLNEILLLKPVTFLYNDENRKIDSDVKEVGFIAQDVFDVIPNAVSSTGTGDLQLDYRAITAALVKAIQKQQALIKALEQRILNLENK